MFDALAACFDGADAAAAFVARASIDRRRSGARSPDSQRRPRVRSQSVAAGSDARLRPTLGARDDRRHAEVLAHLSDRRPHPDARRIPRVLLLRRRHRGLHAHRSLARARTEHRTSGVRGAPRALRRVRRGASDREHPEGRRPRRRARKLHLHPRAVAAGPRQRARHRSSRRIGWRRTAPRSRPSCRSPGRISTRPRNTCWRFLGARWRFAFSARCRCSSPTPRCATLRASRARLRGKGVVKISRSEVKSLTVLSMLGVFSNRWLARLVDRTRTKPVAGQLTT